MTTTTATRSIIQQAHDLLVKYPTIGAGARLDMIRATAETAAEWGDLEFDSNMTARIERDGFQVHVQYVYDEYPDTSWLGEFTDTWQPGAIKHLPGWYGNDYDRPNHSTYGWFIPGNSAEAARDWFRKAGYARHEAWLVAQRQARQDHERMTEITFYDLKVTVSRADIELATDYLGGIDLGDDLPTVDANEQAVFMAIDSIGTALAEAKTAMKKIAAEFVADATID